MAGRRCGRQGFHLVSLLLLALWVDANDTFDVLDKVFPCGCLPFAFSRPVSTRNLSLADPQPAGLGRTRRLHAPPLRTVLTAGTLGRNCLSQGCRIDPRGRTSAGREAALPRAWRGDGPGERGGARVSARERHLIRRGRFPWAGDSPRRAACCLARGRGLARPRRAAARAAPGARALACGARHAVGGRERGVLRDPDAPAARGRGRHGAGVPWGGRVGAHTVRGRGRGSSGRGGGAPREATVGRI
jgi:hypothetical protein